MNLFKTKKANDLQFGIPKEKQMLSHFNKYLNSELKLSDDRYSKFDYIDTKNKIIVELKSRRVKMKKYKDVLVNKGKVDYGFKMIRKGYSVYIAWAFTDQLCIYQLSKKNYSKHWIKNNHLGRYDRGKKEYNDVVFIPVHKMAKITKLLLHN
jgi:hypothetical protein